jgi:hypothetical protein
MGITHPQVHNSLYGRVTARSELRRSERYQSKTVRCSGRSKRSAPPLALAISGSSITTTGTGLTLGMSASGAAPPRAQTSIRIKRPVNHSFYF